MAEFSDEILMAYVDGELVEFERLRVETALRSDPALEFRLAAFRMTRDRLKVAFNDVLYAPLPGRLVETVRRATIGGRLAPKRANIGQKVRGAFDFSGFSESFSLGRMATASAVVLAAAVGANWMLKSGTGSNSAPQVVDLATFAAPGSDTPLVLAQGLDVAPLNKNWAPKKKGFSLRPTLTFATRDGTFCRQFVVSNTAGQAAPGVACRTGEKVWNVVALGKVVSLVADANPALGDNVAPAAHGGGDPAVEAAITGLISGDAIGFNQEANLIANGWKKASGRE